MGTSTYEDAAALLFALRRQTKTDSQNAKSTVSGSKTVPEIIARRVKACFGSIVTSQFEPFNSIFRPSADAALRVRTSVSVLISKVRVNALAFVAVADTRPSRRSRQTGAIRPDFSIA